MSLQKIPLEKATHAQLQEFAEIAGVEGLTEGMRQPEGVAALRALLATAGNASGIYVATPNIALAATQPLAGSMIDDIFDPENERWIRLSIQPDDAGEEAMSNGSVYVSVNNDSAHIPRGEIIVMREILFRHLQVREVRWYQNQHASGMARGKRHSKIVDRYPMSVYGAVGLVKDGPPELQEGDLLVAPGGSQAALISAKQQAQRVHMAA